MSEINTETIRLNMPLSFQLIGLPSMFVLI